MAHRNDPDYAPKFKSENPPNNPSLKEKFEEAAKHIHNSGLKVLSQDGPDKRYQVSSFQVKCKQGHEHTVSIDHKPIITKGTKVVHVYGPSDPEESDPNPEHQGDMKSAIAYLKGKHKHAKSESSDGDD